MKIQVNSYSSTSTIDVRNNHIHDIVVHREGYMECRLCGLKIVMHRAWSMECKFCGPKYAKAGRLSR